MKPCTKIAFNILLIAIVFGLIMSIPSGGGGLISISLGFVIGYYAELFLIPLGIIFSLIALIQEKKENKLYPGLILFIFIIPVVVILGEPYFEEIGRNIDESVEKRDREKREKADQIMSEAYEIMAGKAPLWLIGELNDGYPVYLLDVALINYNHNDTIESGGYLFQLEEMYVHATHKKLMTINSEVSYSICKKRVNFTPVEDTKGMVKIKQYDISCTNYTYKNKSRTKIENANRRYKALKDGHPYGLTIYMNFFTYYARRRIENSEITLIYEDANK